MPTGGIAVTLVIVIPPVRPEWRIMFLPGDSVTFTAMFGAKTETHDAVVVSVSDSGGLVNVRMTDALYDLYTVTVEATDLKFRAPFPIRKESSGQIDLPTQLAKAIGWVEGTLDDLDNLSTFRGDESDAFFSLVNRVDAINTTVKELRERIHAYLQTNDELCTSCNHHAIAECRVCTMRLCAIHAVTRPSGTVCYADRYRIHPDRKES